MNENKVQKISQQQNFYFCKVIVWIFFKFQTKFAKKNVQISI